MKKLIVLLAMFLFFAGVASASAEMIGNDITGRPTLDGATNIAFIDPTLLFPTAGSLDSWSFWARGNDGDVFATQIYRNAGSVELWELVYHQQYKIVGAVNTSFSFPSLTAFNVEAGDVIGWWFGAGGGTIPFTNIGLDEVEWSNYLSTPYSNPQVGDIVNFYTDLWAKSSQLREYSIAANYSPVPEPATMLLLGSGLLGLAAFRKRFLKK